MTNTTIDATENTQTPMTTEQQHGAWAAAQLLGPGGTARAERDRADWVAGRLVTAKSLLAMARVQGMTALGVTPAAGHPCKVLLGSLGLDISNREIQEQLLELNRTGAIDLTRVDAIGLIPADRLDTYQAGRFWSTCCWFDCISFDGAALGGVA